MKSEDFTNVAQPNVYHDRSFGMMAAKILPGEYYVTKRNMLIVTVLGSCVSTCMRDPDNLIGGMNHFMLPQHGGDAKSLISMSARYGAYAMEVLINQLLSLGAKRDRLEAKVFGGGRVLAGMTDVGQRNAEFVREYLRHERIKISAQDLGNTYPRKVYFFPQTGKVLVKQLRTLHNDTIYNREKYYAAQLEAVAVTGADLFK
ncbi:MAG: chemoreceptor glutamine deamidase CheD [Pseudomonadota bacterium]|nr:chemoreceptor glutamine deamidase CheD [Pseudomonadota bacterium]